MPDVEPYPIYSLNPNDAQEIEWVGSKEKFWLQWALPGSETADWWLYKKPKQQDLGEDWAERVAADVAGTLKLPHARYELARLDDAESEVEWGILSCRMFDKSLVVETLGNAFLTGIAGAVDYPPSTDEMSYQERQRARTSYTPLLVLDALDRVGVRPAEGEHGAESAVDLFVGYLMLDALISNTDRHDENWGVLAGSDGSLSLMPTFDHASSLGRELKDTKRSAKLNSTTAPHDLVTYASNARSRFHHPMSGDRVSPLLAFSLAADAYPAAASFWLSRLSAFGGFPISDLLRRIPSHRISPIGVTFAEQLVAHNERALLAMNS